MQEMHGTEIMMRVLEKSIQDKKHSLKLAETRLKERTNRINVENCYDEPMKRYFLNSFRLYLPCAYILSLITFIINFNLREQPLVFQNNRLLFYISTVHKH